MQVASSTRAHHAVKILDDDDTRAMLELYPVANIIELYVKKDYVCYQLPKSHEKFSRMLIWTMNQRVT